MNNQRLIDGDKLLRWIDSEREKWNMARTFGKEVIFNIEFGRFDIPSNQGEATRLLAEAKSIYSAWNWDMLEAEMESGYDQGAFRDLVTMYVKMVDHIERLEIALHTHKSYDKTVSELHDENTRLRDALEKIVTLIDREAFRTVQNVAIEALSSHTEDTGIQLRPEVRWFAEQMEKTLRDNDHKGGWNEMSHWELVGRLEEEVAELKKWKGRKAR